MKKFNVPAVLTCVGLLASPVTKADESFWDWAFSFKRMKEVAPVKDEVYLEECGSCHFPFQPGLLPSASWAKLIDTKALTDHFGDNAELDEDTRLHIAKILEENAADKSQHKRSKKIMGSLSEGEAPLRITETPYIKGKHSEIPQRLIKDNPQVKTLSACAKCHQKASEGIFDDDTVNIPGHGHW